MKNSEKPFDSNSFTRNAMPLSTILCELFDQAYCNTASDDMSACMDKYADMNDEFINSLDDEQQQLFEEIGYTIDKTSEIDFTEHFNRGFKLGALLMAEVFGKNA